MEESDQEEGESRPSVEGAVREKGIVSWGRREGG